MKAAIVTPYGLGQGESGILYLLGAHLHSLGAAVAQLRCNGTLPICERDAMIGFKRNVTTCIACMQQQRELATWAGIKSFELSRFITIEKVAAASSFVNSATIDQMKRLNFSGVPVLDLVEEMFVSRFGVLPDSNNKGHEQFFRSLVISALRVNEALKEFRVAWQPSLILIPGTESFINKLVILQNAEPGRQVALFKVNREKRCTEVTLALGNKQFECPLMVDELAAMRNDTKSWTVELTSLLDELLSFIAPGHDVVGDVVGELKTA